MQGDAPRSSAGIPSGKSQPAPGMLPDVHAGRGPATEPSPSSSSRSRSSRRHRSRAKRSRGWGVVGRAQSRAGRPGRSTARPGAPAVQAPEQRLRAGPARVAHQAPAHGSPQPGGWDSIGGESTGSSSKSRALQELGSLTARSSKNCISESCILRVPNPPPRVGSSSESWILQELDPPRTGSSEHQILL